MTYMRSEIICIMGMLDILYHSVGAWDIGIWEASVIWPGIFASIAHLMEHFIAGNINASLSIMHDCL